MRDFLTPNVMTTTRVKGEEKVKKLMRYHVITGRVVEEVASLLSSRADRKKPRGVRRAGASSLAKIKANEKSSVRRLARGIAANFSAGDAFATLKYDAAHYPGSLNAAENVPGSEGYTRAEDDREKFLRKLKRLYRKQTGKTLKAYWETANWHPADDGGHASRLHQHMVLPSDAVELARRLWPEFGGEGTVNIKDLDSDPDRTRLAEYMVGNVHGKLPGAKGWSGTRGMDKPVLSEPEEIGSVDEIQPPPGAVIKEVREVTDEDGLVIGKYLRYVLPVAPKIRGGQIVLPRANKRGEKRAAAAGGR